MNQARNPATRARRRGLCSVLFGLTACAGVGLSACSVTADPGSSATAFYPAVPHLPPSDPRPPAPSTDAVWVPASYEWDGAAYALQPGAWKQSVPVMQIWQPGHWALGQSAKYEWIKGRWIDMNGNGR